MQQLELAMVETLAIRIGNVVVVFLLHITDGYVTYYIDFVCEDEFMEGGVIVLAESEHA
jgi:hypothetical protein